MAKDFVGMVKKPKTEWKLLQKKDGKKGSFEMWKSKLKTHKLFMGKAIAEIDASLEQVVEYMTRFSTYCEHQLEIDPNLANCSVVESWGEDTIQVGTSHEAIYTVRAVLGFGMSDRLGTYYERNFWEDEDTCWTLYSSLDQHGVQVPGPELEKGAVAFTMTHGCYCFQRKGNKTVATSSLHADPGGWIPAWIINMAIKQLGKSLLKISENIAKL